MWRREWSGSSYYIDRTITITPKPEEKVCYITKYGDILPSNPSTNENNNDHTNSIYDTLEHELFHALNDITLNKIYGQPRDYCKDSWDPNWIESISQDFKYKYSYLVGEGETIKSFSELLVPIYDNPAEMLAMYGIAYYNGKLYYEPINEAVATTQINYYGGKKRSIIRAGHRSNLNEYNIQMLFNKTNAYKYYFQKQERLRELITNLSSEEQPTKHKPNRHRNYKIKY